MGRLWDSIVGELSAYWQKLATEGLGPLLTSLVVAALIGLLTLAVARLAARTTRHAFEQATREPEVALLVGRLTHLGVSLLGIGWMMSVLGVPWGALVGFFSFVGIGLSLALQDLFRNIIAGLYLLVERPYRMGDFVSVRGLEGTVEDVRLRTTNLRMADGRLMVVPNMTMLTDVIIAGKGKEEGEAQPLERA